MPNIETLLLDGDTIVYRAGFAADKKRYVVRVGNEAYAEFDKRTELDSWLVPYIEDNDKEVEIEHRLIPDPLGFALQNVSTTVENIKGQFPEHSMAEIYIGGPGNFRKELATLKPYKGNRSEFARPTHYDAIRDYLISHHHAILVEGQETDDALGIRSTALGDSSVIITNDKDLNTIPGWHYNWVKRELFYVTEEQSYRHFYTQLLTGDSSDNVPGLEGVGPKTAAAILKGYSTPRGMWQAVLHEYVKRCPDGFMGRGVKEALTEIGNLLYIRKYENEKWSFPC